MLRFGSFFSDRSRLASVAYYIVSGSSVPALLSLSCVEVCGWCCFPAGHHRPRPRPRRQDVVPYVRLIEAQLAHHPSSSVKSKKCRSPTQPQISFPIYIWGLTSPRRLATDIWHEIHHHWMRTTIIWMWHNCLWMNTVYFLDTTNFLSSRTLI